MKVLSICTIVVAMATSSLQDYAEVQKACQLELPVSRKEWENFAANATNVNEGLKCHIKCITEKLKLLKNGIFDVQAYDKLAQSHPDFKKRRVEIIKAGEECKKEKGANICDTAFKIFVCLCERKVIEINQ